MEYFKAKVQVIDGTLYSEIPSSYIAKYNLVEEQFLTFDVSKERPKMGQEHVS